MKKIWLSKEEIAALPTTGAAWDAVLKAANSCTGAADLVNQDSASNVLCMAAALVYARTGDTKYLDKVKAALTKVANGLSLGRALALGRELCAYVLAADLIDLPAIDAALDAKFSNEIKRLLTASTSGGPKNLTECHKVRPNNWGTHAGASRLAVALYLGDAAEVADAAKVFKGWLGDRASYASFTYADLSWQVDQKAPVGINPVGATLQGHSVDGVLPDDMRRGGSFAWPPPGGDGRMYSWEALQGALVQAQLLSRAGYDAWNWCDKALLRAVKFLYGLNWPAGGDDGWMPWLINAAYGTEYPALPNASPGKNVGWTQWTHAGKGVITPPPPPPPPDPPPATDPDVVKALSILADVRVSLSEAETLIAQAAKALGG